MTKEEAFYEEMNRVWTKNIPQKQDLSIKAPPTLAIPLNAMTNLWLLSVLGCL